jgi:hypothetical protein
VSCACIAENANKLKPRNKAFDLIDFIVFFF